MKLYSRLLLTVLIWLIANSDLSAKNIVSEISPAKAGIVSADRVNVRARASLIGERVTQLRKGDSVKVLAKVTVESAKEGEPSEWLKIAMPAGGQTWVYMAFVKDGKITANRLNVRAGGSEHFGIVGRLAKGDIVKEKRSSGDWIEIEHPDGAHAFVSAKYIKIGAGIEKKESPTETKGNITEDLLSKSEQGEEIKESSESSKDSTLIQQTSPDNSPKIKEEGDKITDDSEIAQEKLGDQDKVSDVGTDGSGLEKNPEEVDMPDLPEPELVLVEEGTDNNKKPAGNPEDVEEAKPESATVTKKKELPVPPPRIVTREGKIKRRFFRSPKAPSRYELVDENGRTLNYLFSSEEGPLKAAGDGDEPITFGRLMNMLRNRKVVLTGVEAVDPRWPALPLLDVRTLKTVP
ncbi:MAG: SH3 domain-containing protein [Verrucomicrobiota bacterium]|jgi:uncharacterized protein YgiM (DUF1202 family)|nr:SH3 domain-containing protein [Verrucomicrobiota bacterium]